MAPRSPQPGGGGKEGLQEFEHRSVPVIDVVLEDTGWPPPCLCAGSTGPRPAQSRPFPPRTGVRRHRGDVAGVRIASRRAGCGRRNGKLAEEPGPAEPARVERAWPGVQGCGFRTRPGDSPASRLAREKTGQTGRPAPRTWRNRGSGSKALGMVSPGK
ncbi:uncharacterized protein AruCF_5086 [Achromobacter ruhlandii]|nr:uncharacterized protein AruCF_5086 [Achromobacter ruhlandii]